MMARVCPEVNLFNVYMWTVYEENLLIGGPRGTKGTRNGGLFTGLKVS